MERQQVLVPSIGEWISNPGKSAAEMSVMALAVTSPRRAAERSGPLTITAAAAILTMLGGVNSRSSPSAPFDAAKGQRVSTMRAAPKTNAAASDPV